MTGVVALVAARDERERIGSTVEALRALGPVREVVVVDDGSRDDTAARSLSAGATVFRHERPRGKGRALERAIARLADRRPDAWLLADADLADSAGALDRVLAPVLDGRADLAVAAFPPGRGGGFGIVKRAAGLAIRATSGVRVAEPLSGQRAIAREALEAVRPLARGFGVETAMTIDAVRAGLRIVEVATPLTHRTTYRDLRGFVHRGRQGWDIVRAVVPRALGLR